MKKSLFGRHRAILFWASFLANSCSSLQLPLEPPNFAAQELLHAGDAGVNLRVKPIEGIQSYWQLFNENLPEAGIGAIWVVLSNTQTEAIDLSKARWTLTFGHRDYARASASEILKRYYERRHIRMYAVFADETAKKNIEDLEFHMNRLGPSMNRAGFLFFKIKPGREQNWTRGATLQLNNIMLSDGRQIAIALPLPYAHP